MKLKFVKMHGAGNDFMVVDRGKFPFEAVPELIRAWCDRKKGIGADGVIGLTALGGNRVRMDFFNCDGSRAGMCGNGLRCAGVFAWKFGLSDGAETEFVTDSGCLYAEVLERGRQVRIELPLNQDFSETPDVCGCRGYQGVVGVPHLVVPVKGAVDDVDVERLGRALRFAPEFAPDGVNVDFIGDPDKGGAVPVRTYERGVEGETLACGTGIGSSALVRWKFLGAAAKQSFLCRAGDLITVEIIAKGDIVLKIKLTGPAVMVYSGETTDPE